MLFRSFITNAENGKPSAEGDDASQLRTRHQRRSSCFFVASSLLGCCDRHSLLQDLVKIPAGVGCSSAAQRAKGQRLVHHYVSAEKPAQCYHALSPSLTRHATPSLSHFSIQQQCLLCRGDAPQVEGGPLVGTLVVGRLLLGSRQGPALTVCLPSTSLAHDLRGCSRPHGRGGLREQRR